MYVIAGFAITFSRVLTSYVFVPIARSLR